jgi:hypothetical protein
MIWLRIVFIKHMLMSQLNSFPIQTFQLNPCHLHLRPFLSTKQGTGDLARLALRSHNFQDLIWNDLNTYIYMAYIWLIYFVAVNMHVICRFHASQNLSQPWLQSNSLCHDHAHHDMWPWKEFGTHMRIAKCRNKSLCTCIPKQRSNQLSMYMSTSCFD